MCVPVARYIAKEMLKRNHSLSSCSKNNIAESALLYLPFVSFSEILPHNGASQIHKLRQLISSK
jgi:hypothetical protein